ncbi:MAG: sigma-70 family RNA polymerase sigma factor [Gemmataceae bacterium]|nr:sigma-70 family RNA polymerase sigma factor [Gemmataceae bacterium]
MANGHLGGVLRHLQKLIRGSQAGSLTDRQLLERFARERDQGAFTALVERHGPLVMGVCRRVLANAADAEDAFQATFLVLARKAGGRSWQESVGNWLYGVAWRTAIKARTRAQRRRAHERHAPVKPAVEPDHDFPDLRPVLDQELQHLPDRYRAPLVLCYLQGRSTEEAARELGCPFGTVSSRLARGRDLLRARLARRGVQVSAGALTTALVEQATASALPSALIALTSQSALAFAVGPTAGGVAGPVASLAEGVLQAMFWARWKLTALVVLALVALAAPATLLFQRDASAGAMPADTPEAPKAANAPMPRLDDFGDPLPPGALARRGTLRYRPPGGANVVAYSPDGKLLATRNSWSLHPSVRVWEAETGREVCRIALQSPSDVRAIAFAADGKSMVFADRRQAIPVVDTASGKPIGQFGRYLDGTEHLTPRIVHEGLRPPEGSVERRLFEGHQQPVNALTISPDGKLLASAAEDIRIWDAVTRKPIRQIKTVGMSVPFLAFTADSKVLAWGGLGRPNGNSRVSLYEVATGKELTHIVLEDEFDLTALVLSRDGRQVAVEDERHNVQVLEMPSGKLRTRFKYQAGANGSGPLAFSADGRTLFVGSSEGVHVWDLDATKELRRMRCVGGYGQALALTPDGKTLAVGGQHSIHLFDPVTGQERHAFSHVPGGEAVFYGPDGRALIRPNEKDRLRLVDALTGKTVQEFEVREKLEGPHFAIAPDFRSVAAGTYEYRTGYLVTVWDMKTGQWLRRFGPFQAAAAHFAFAPDGKTLVTSAWDGKALLWDLATGKETGQLVGHDRWLATMAFSTDGKHFAAVDGGKGTLLVWDAASSKEVRRLEKRRETYPEPLGLTQDGKAALVRVNDQLLLQDFATGKELFPLPGGNSSPGELLFSPDGRLLAQGGDDGSVRVWEISSRTERCRFLGHQLPIRSLAFARDGRVLASGSDDGTNLFWDMTGRVEGGTLAVATLTPEQLQTCWTALADADGRKAHAALWTLVAAARQALPFLQEHLLPVAIDDAWIERRIRLLDDEKFDVRLQAAAELERAGTLAGPALRQALMGKPSLELRRRAERLLEVIAQPGPSAEQLRFLRAMELLETIGTPEARRIVEQVAKGARGARVTIDAAEVLARMTAKEKK